MAHSLLLMSCFPLAMNAVVRSRHIALMVHSGVSTLTNGRRAARSIDRTRFQSRAFRLRVTPPRVCIALTVCRLQNAIKLIVATHSILLSVTLALFSAG